MDYQTFRPATKPSYKQRTSNRKNFAGHNNNYVNKSKPSKPLTRILRPIHVHKVKIYHNQLQTQYFSMINQDLHEITVKNTHFFNKIKIKPNINYTKKQTPCYTTHYSPSEDEESYKQNHQGFYTNQRLHSCNIDQPDIFEPYTHDERVRQPRNNPTSYNKIFQPQNPVNTQSYQLTQMHNEIP